MSGFDGRVSSGIADLDQLMNGLIPGDNVVWVVDDAELMTRIEDDFLMASGRARLPRAYVMTSGRPEVVRDRVGPDVLVLDARPRQPHADATVLEQELMQFCASR